MDSNLTELEFRKLFDSIGDDQRNIIRQSFLFGPKKFAIEFYTINRETVHYIERWESFIKLRRFGGNKIDDYYTPFGFYFKAPNPNSCFNWETIGIFCCGVDYENLVTQAMGLELQIDKDESSDNYLMEYVNFNNEKLYAGTAEFEDLLRSINSEIIFPWEKIVDGLWISYLSFING
ncbi:MAG: hypothetical protein ACRC37_07775, partial [Lentisphaeria bacterium]